MSSAEETREARYLGLIGRIHSCRTCIGNPSCRIPEDPEREARAPDPSPLNSEVMVVGRALGAGTQRLSGWPWLTRDGHDFLSTGRQVDRFVRSFGYTLRPNADLPYAYATDLVKCWPGRGTSGRDLPPTQSAIENCIPFLEEEIQLVRPLVVILLGDAPRTAFLRYALSPTPHVENGELYLCRVAGWSGFGVSIPHPASATPRRHLYEETGRKIRRALAGTV